MIGVVKIQRIWVIWRQEVLKGKTQLLHILIVPSANLGLKELILVTRDGRKCWYRLDVPTAAGFVPARWELRAYSVRIVELILGCVKAGSGRGGSVLLGPAGHEILGTIRAVTS